MPQIAKNVNTENAEKRREHNLNLALKIAEVFAIHPCLDKSPLAKRHTEIDTAIDRKAAIEMLRLQHEKAQARLPENERSEFRIPFQIGSSKNPETIQRWADEAPDFVPGLSGGAGNGLYIVDCDKAKKEGDVDGVDFFHALAQDNGFDLSTVPATLTQSGGRHYFFRNPRRLGCTAKGFSDKNIQIRADGGYVIAPGSIRKDGRMYTPIDGHPDLLDAAAFPEINGLMDAPKWLIDAAFSSAITDHEYKAAPSNYDPEDPTIADRYLFELERRYPEVIHVGARHDTAREAAHLGFDCGLEEERIVEILREWFSTHCEDPLHDGEIEDLTRRMLSRRQDAIGRDYIANWKRAGYFGAVDDGDEIDVETGEAITAPLKRSKLMSAADIFEEPLDKLAKPLIDELVSFGDTGCVYGNWGTGKTFLLLDMALHVASGKSWAALDVTKAAVLYCAAENPLSVRRRVKGWLKHHDAGPDLPLYVLSDALKVDTKPGRDELIARAKEVQAASGVPLGLIVIDTLAKSMAGNENETQDMNAVVATATEAARLTGAACIYVHHTNRAGEMRGSIALPGGVEVLIAVEKGKTTAKKLKDEEFLPSIPFELKSVYLGQKANGKPITTAVAICGAATRENAETKAVVDVRKRPSPCAQYCLTAALDLESKKRGVGPLSDPEEDDWADAPVRMALDWREIFAGASEARMKIEGKPLTDNSSNKLRLELIDRAWLVDLGGGKIALA